MEKNNLLILSNHYLTFVKDQVGALSASFDNITALVRFNPARKLFGYRSVVDISPTFPNVHVFTTRVLYLPLEINDNMPSYILHKARRIFEMHNITNPIVTILGVAYKGNIDDTRETPALKLIKLCAKEGWKVKLSDPYVNRFEYPLLSLEDAARDSDLIIIETDHTYYCSLDAARLAELMRNRIVIDTKNILDKSEFKENGFEIHTLGGNISGTKNVLSKSGFQADDFEIRALRGDIIEK